MSPIFAIGGVALLALAVLLFMSHRKWRSTALNSPGTVTNVREATTRQEGRTSTTYYPTVRYEVQGRVIEHAFSIGGSTRYVVGQTVTVYYQPGTPEKPQLGALSVRLFFALFLCVVSLVVFAYGYIQRQNEKSARSLERLVPSAPAR